MGVRVVGRGLGAQGGKVMGAKVGLKSACGREVEEASETSGSRSEVTEIQVLSHEIEMK